ncbi:MAG: iron hydrogenase [Candidatus Pacebacteria bacterium]|nr:iron hydrogenase [Candidatus Paceibacterota bacterium]
MNQSKAIAIKKDFSLLINFAVVLSLAVVSPLLSNQLLTGTLVNSLLVISVFLFGFGGAFLIIFIPSIISWFLGLLPLAMGPMIPFIFLGNAIFVVMIDKLKNINYWLAGGIAASAKAIFLFVSSYALFNFFLGGAGIKIAASMMSYMQILTAIFGVILAYGVLRIMKRI